MIQDIFPHIMHNSFKPGLSPDADSIVIALNGNDVLIKGDLFPKLSDLPWLDRGRLTYLFGVDDENRYFLYDVETPDEIKAPEGYEFVNIRKLRSSGFPKKYRVFVAFTALQLANWYRNNRFCGRCGKMTFLDDKERAIRCECGNIIYPRIVPAVIVGVTNGDKLLVTKYARGFAHYALVAGFTEIGETLEETAAREVMEETGLKVKNIRYYKSQPWGIVDDLLVGYFCDLDGSDAITMDSSELKVAEWRSRDEIELQPDDYSLTNEMMKMFKEGRI